MYATIESITHLKGGMVRFAINFYSDDDRKLFGFAGNRILVNEKTGNINIFPVSIKMKKQNLQVGFIHFSLWSAIYQAIRQAIDDSGDDKHLLAVNKVRLEI